MNWGAVIVAAGRGTRFGRPKQFVEIAGLPMVGWSIQALNAISEIYEFVIVTETEWFEQMAELARFLAPTREVHIVRGGDSRQESAYHGLSALSQECDAVMIHDGARPLVLPEDIRVGMREVRVGRGAVLAAPVVDTIKVVEAKSRRVQKTLDREELWGAQTPQFAMRRDFMSAHSNARQGKIQATDDVALLEEIGIDVLVVPASDVNFKVTHPRDVTRADALLRERLERV